MKDQTVPVVLNLIAAFMGAFGQYLYRQGAARLGEVKLYENWQIFAGMLLFIGVMGLFVAAFRMGGLLSVTYPVYATTFVWGALISVLLLHEPFAPGQAAGLGFILFGVALVGYFAPGT